MMNGGTPILGNHHIFDSITISVYGGFRSPRDVPQACWMVDFMENSNLIPSPVHTKHPSLWSQWNVGIPEKKAIVSFRGCFLLGQTVTFSFWDSHGVDDRGIPRGVDEGSWRRKIGRKPREWPSQQGKTRNKVALPCFIAGDSYYSLRNIYV